MDLGPRKNLFYMLIVVNQIWNKWVKLTPFNSPRWWSWLVWVQKSWYNLIRRSWHERAIEWLYTLFTHMLLLGNWANAQEKPKSVWQKSKGYWRHDKWLAFECASKLNHRSISREWKPCGLEVLEYQLCPNHWLHIKLQRCRDDCLGIRLKCKSIKIQWKHQWMFTRSVTAYECKIKNIVWSIVSDGKKLWMDLDIGFIKDVGFLQTSIINVRIKLKEIYK